jgi:protoporphyrinogen oxidase
LVASARLVEWQAICGRRANELNAKKTTIVLGGGITGIAAAYRLAKTGHHVIVIEKESAVGGLAGSVIRNGAIFDFGAHAFLLDDNMTKGFYSIIPKQDLNVFKKDVQIKFGERYFQYPLDAIDILRKLSPSIVLLCLFDYAISKLRMSFGSPTDDSAESWIINRFGKSLYKIYFENYTEKVWGLHPRFIAPSFTEERIPLLNLWTTIKSAVKKGVAGLLGGEKAGGTSGFIQLYYPRRGLPSFFHQLVNTIDDNKGTIYLNSEIVDINLNGQKVKAVSLKNGTDVKTINCDYVVSTIPINDLVNSITPKVNSLVRTSANSLRFRALLFVNLMIRKEKIFNVQWIYFRNRIFNRVSEMNKFSKELLPKGLSGLCAEITCDEDDDIWNANERQLCERVIEELVEEGFINQEDVIDAFVARKEHGYPVADLDYERNRKTLFEFVERIENLYITGRQGLFRYLQMDHCIKMGFSVAEHLMSEQSKGYGNPQSYNSRLFV